MKVAVMKVAKATVMVAACALAPVAAAEPAKSPLVLRPGRPPATPSAATLDFSELYLFGPREPALTARARALHGRVVTMVGFMVQLDQPPTGGFYLAATPAAGDESGAGRGDLPPTAILVRPRSATGRTVAFVPGPLEVSGVLDIGNLTTEGEPSTVRVLVDDVRQVRFARLRRAERTARITTEPRRAER